MKLFIKILLFLALSPSVFAAKVWESQDPKFVHGPGLSIEIDASGRIHYSFCSVVNPDTAEFSNCSALGRAVGYLPAELLILKEQFAKIESGLAGASIIASAGLDVIVFASSFWLAGRVLSVGRLAFQKWFIRKYGAAALQASLSLHGSKVHTLKRIATEGSRIVLAAVVFQVITEKSNKSFISKALNPASGVFRAFHANYWNRMKTLFNPRITQGSFNFNSVAVTGLEMDSLIADVEKFLHRIDGAHCMTPMNTSCDLFRKLEYVRSIEVHDASI